MKQNILNLHFNFYKQHRLPLWLGLLYLIMISSCIGIKSPFSNTRLRAIQKITDQNVLARIAFEDDDYKVRGKAIDKITDQSILFKLATESKTVGARERAIKRITDQSVLANTLFTNNYPGAQVAAIENITDQNVLARVPFEIDNIWVQLTAVEKITDQTLLERIALKSEFYTAKEYATKKITDQQVLLKIALDPHILRIDFSKVHLEDGNKEWYIKMHSWEFRKIAIDRISDQSLLVKVASETNNEEVRNYAGKKIIDKSLFIKTILESNQWEVRKSAFNELDTISLIKISKLTNHDDLVIAAKIRLNQTTWTEEFSKSSNSIKTLGNIIGAAALVNSPQPLLSDILSACHKYIGQGDASRIPELINLLNRYGDKTLAEDYINCGRNELENAGKLWGENNGYNIRPGAGSHRVRWGSN